MNTFLEKVLQKSVRPAFSNHKQNNAKALFDSEPIACEASKKDGLIKNALRKTGFGALKTKYHPVVEQRKYMECTLQQEQAKNTQPYFV